MKKVLKPVWKNRESRQVSARKVSNYMGADVTVYESIDPSITSEFVGYDNTECDGNILVLTTDDRDCTGIGRRRLWYNHYR